MALNRTPLCYGPLGQTHKELKNTYFVTESGLIIPDPVCFFGDSFRAVGQIREFAQLRNHETPDEVAPIDNLRNIVYDGQKTIDELIRMKDRLQGNGKSDIELKGFYLPEAEHFFNMDNLKHLYGKLSQRHYEPKENELTPSFKNLESYWMSMKKEYDSYFNKLQAEGGRDKRLEDLGVIFID
jgi:hypothetical protein